MLDHPKKAAELITTMKAAVPFKIALMPQLVEHLRAEHLDIATTGEHVVSDLSYAGDEGGIVCHIVPAGTGGALVVSLTHILVPRSLPFAAAVVQYQKHRIKKLRKQGQA